MDRKQEKQTFRGLGWIENENFHASEPSDEQNRPPFFAEMSVGSRKIAIFYRKSEKTGFPHPGESQNHPKTAFPNFGKVKNAQKQRFPTLGKSKTPENSVSQPWESQKCPKTAFPNLGKGKNTPRRLLQKKILILHWPREPARAFFFAK